MLRIDDYWKSRLLITAYREAYGFGAQAWLPSCLIMCCIANRQKLGWGSWKEIFANLQKYSAYNDPYINQHIELDTWEPVYQKLSHEVEAIYSGSGKDYSNGGIYWCDSTNVNRQWFKDNILDITKHKKVADCNNLMCFK